MTFEHNVFINCPFDDDYLGLLRPMLFTVIFLGLQPRIALEGMDAGQARIDRLLELIRTSRYSIHDLSRITASQPGEFYRLNMPFELGIEFGCRHFGADPLHTKKTLVLETQPHQYRAALSDLSGFDVLAHRNEPYRVITLVRHWLQNVGDIRAPGPARIEAGFTEFMADIHDELGAQGFSAHDVTNLPIGELIQRMQDWTTRHPRQP